MPRFKQLIPALLLLLVTFTTASAATEIDLIYNLSGPDAKDCQAAWHGARVAKHMLDKSGKGVDLVLYNGQSVTKLNAAIAKMRSESKSTSIFIGLGTPNEIIAAAKPLLAANKVFIAANAMTDDEQAGLGDRFFSISPRATPEGDLASAHFDKLYKAQFHQEPTAAAYEGYNAVMLAAAALEATAEKTPAQLAMTMKRLSANPSLSLYPLLSAES